MIYSIGYGNRSWQETLHLLQQYHCEFLIDVRSNPHSKFNSDYNQEVLSVLCAQSRIRYLYMGDVLGGKPSDKCCYDTDGKVDYIRVAETRQFQTGLARLKVAWEKDLSPFVMCSELRPEMCHRSKLIGAELLELGIIISHVDENGQIITQDQAIGRITGGQDDMFGGDPQVTRSRGSYGVGM